MTSIRWDRWAKTSVAFAIGSTLAACGGEAATSPTAAAPPPASVAPAPVAPPPPTAAAPAAAAPAASAAPAAEPPPNAAGAELAEGEEHRHRHHGGVLMLVAMSLKDLDLSADQRTAVDKIRADLLAKMEPARAAGKDLANTLADGVAAGAVNRAKADAAVGKLVTQVQAEHDAALAALDQLHAALTAPQRTALVDAMQSHWEKWKEAQGHEEGTDKQHHPGHLLELVRDLGLTKDQAEKIKTKFHDLMKGAPQDQQHKEVQDHLQAFGTAFKADNFSAKSLSKAKAANGHMARWGATRMERFFEAAAPILTPDQRTKLAAEIRDRASKPEA
jgi:Spy/CpxP family protein refolding chaperone